MATRDLSVQAILTANTTPFANGMKSASDAAKRFSSDMKRIRQEINQPLYVPKPGQKDTPQMVLFGGTISEGLAAQRFRQIQRIERMALVARDKWLEPFLNPETMERGWVRFGTASDRAFGHAERSAFKFAGAAKKAFAGLGLGLGLAADFAGSDSTTGRLFGAAGNIAGQAAIGGIAGGVPGAVAFGGFAVLREWKELGRLSKEHAENREKATQAALTELRANSLLVQQQTQGIREAVLPGPQANLEQALNQLQFLERLNVGRQRLHDETRRELFQNNPALFTETGRIAAEQRTAINAEIDAARVEIQKIQDVQALQGLFGIAGRGLNAGGGALSRGIGGGITALSGLLRGPAGQGVQFIRRIQDQLASQMAIADRVQMLMGQSTMMGVPLAIRGSNEYLRAISDQPNAEQDIGKLVKLAEQQLQEEKLQRQAIEKSVAQNVTVKM